MKRNDVYPVSCPQPSRLTRVLKLLCDRQAAARYHVSPEHINEAVKLKIPDPESNEFLFGFGLWFQHPQVLAALLFSAI